MLPTATDFEALAQDVPQWLVQVQLSPRVARFAALRVSLSCSSFLIARNCTTQTRRAATFIMTTTHAARAEERSRAQRRPREESASTCDFWKVDSGP